MEGGRVLGDPLVANAVLALQLGELRALGDIGRSREM